MTRIAYFDFDGTITRRDTLLEFIKFRKGVIRFYAGFLLNSPWLLAYKLKWISNQSAKERILTHFFRGTALDEFQADGDRFAQTVVPGLVRPKAAKEIRKLMEAGTEIVIVSASPLYWIKAWSDALPARLIATELAVRDGKLTGKIAGKNVHGQEKVRRIQELCPPGGYQEVYAYGDTKGDKPMMGLAALRFYRPFR